MTVRQLSSALILAVAATGSTLAQDITYRGNPVRLNPRPTPVGNTWLLPVRATAEKIGARIWHNGSEATIEWQGNRADFRVGGSNYVLNGRRQPFREDCLQRGGVLYLEARFFENLTDGALRVYDDRYGNNRPGDPGNREGWVAYDGRTLRFDRGLEPFMVGRTLLVPFRAVGDQIGARLERTEDGKRVIIRHGRNEVVYDRGRTWYRINRQRRELATAARDRGDVYYVPVELFEAATGGRLDWGRDRD